jgi:uncharacterized caspase-like protein
MLRSTEYRAIYTALLLIFLAVAPSFAAAPGNEVSDRSLAVRKKSAAVERRVALLIGNSSYQDAPLKNPVNDADAMARILREAGFDVILHKNVDRRKMILAIKEFGQKLKKNDVGLFYYAGHGVQVDSANFLLPVDLKGSDLQDADDLRHYAFPLNEILDRMRDASTNNIIILDACRDNPFMAKLSRSATRGLAKINTPASTTILYSTDPGNTASDGVGGDNGAFTSRLVESIQKDGLELVDVMRDVAVHVTRDTNGAQRPIFDGVLSTKFYFRAPEAAAQKTAPEVGSSAITVDPKVMELRYWESAEKSGTASAYQLYIKRFPGGDFADLARDRLEQMAAQKNQDKISRVDQDRIDKEKAAHERAAQEAAERTRLANERAELERRIEVVNSQLAAKPQVVAALPPLKSTGKENVREKIGSFIISELTVIDEKYGLTWVRDAKVPGKKSYPNTRSVVVRMNSSNYAGFDDWRLPSDNDYQVLYSSIKSAAHTSDSKILHVINKLFVNYSDWNSWMFTRSIITEKYGYQGAYTFDISDGTSLEKNKDDELDLFMVRGTIK